MRNFTTAKIVTSVTPYPKKLSHAVVTRYGQLLITGYKDASMAALSLPNLITHSMLLGHTHPLSAIQTLPNNTLKQ